MDTSLTHLDAMILAGYRSTHQRGNKVTAATIQHERRAMAEWTWPALPAHLRSLPDARAMVRHWVATDYQWKP